jgi:pilus assembly protein CpaC
MAGRPWFCERARIMRPFALFSLMLATAPSLAQPEGGVISLGVGQQKVIQLGSVSRVAIGEPEVADVKQVGGGGELLITGVGEGRTSLLVWRNNDTRLSYMVVVRRQDPKDLVSEVRALLGDREGIQARVVGDRVYLDGETLTTDDYDRVQQILQLYPTVRSFVRPSGNARKLAAEAMNRALQKNGFRGVSASVLGSTLVLEGSVESKDDLKKLELVSRATGERAENLVAVGVRKMVLVEVDFVEASSGSSKSVGIKAPSTLISTGEGLTATVNIVQPLRGVDSGQTQKSGSLTVNATAATDFSAQARFGDGAVRVLSQPRLVCASGEKAEFVAGGEIPVLMATQNQFAVEFKKFGIILKITPTADRSGNIVTEIYAEVSDLDRSIAVRANGFEVPGFRVREVKTSVTVKDGETIILSGLFNYTEDKEVSKVPLLGHIPILGELFKSRSFIEHKTELAIYVTPRVISPATERAKDLLDDAHKLYRNAEDSVSFSLFD